jgi:hypothetical protein
MFEHFFAANSPFAGLVNCHWPMPLHGLAATGPFWERSCFCEGYTYWRKEISKALEEIWQQTKARDDAREMEEHVERFNDTRRTQRATSTGATTDEADH